jgi:hypothetical protein
MFNIHLLEVKWDTTIAYRIPSVSKRGKLFKRGANGSSTVFIFFPAYSRVQNSRERVNYDVAEGA